MKCTQKNRQQKKYSLIVSSSVLFLIVVWHVASIFVNSVLILPPPILVFERLLELAHTNDFWIQIAGTLVRCMYAFFLSIIISLALGIVSAMFNVVAIFLQFPLTMIKSTPVVSFILLAIFWFTSSTVPIFVSVLLTVPVLTAAITNGIKATDIKLLEMTKIFKLTIKQKIRNVYIPSTMPHFLSAALSSLGLTWKVVVAGEVLTLPKNSVGVALQTAKVHLETIDVFAWTIAVVILSYCAELVFMCYVRRTHKNVSRYTKESHDD